MYGTDWTGKLVLIDHLVMIQFLWWESIDICLVFQVLGVAAHPRERLLLSSDSLGALHAWQYNPIT